MDNNKRQVLRSRLEPFGHVLAGFLILLKSTVVGEHHPALGVLLFVLGVLFLVIAIFHHQLNTKFSMVAHRLLFLLESFALWIVVYELIAEHKHYLQYAYSFAALMYLLLAILFPKLRVGKKVQTAQSH